MIDRCEQSVVEQIENFKQFASDLASKLKDTFNQIKESVAAAIEVVAERVNSAIEEAARQLKEIAVDLANTVKEMVEFAANFVVVQMKAHIRIALAVLTGNFDEIPKIMFIAACDSIGLPGEVFYQILSRAGLHLLDIIQHPGSFLSNLIDAGKKGFFQFMDNIRPHLKSGLMGWLFGQVADSGLSIPKSFDKPSVFKLVLLEQIVRTTMRRHLKSRSRPST